MNIVDFNTYGTLQKELKDLPLKPSKVKLFAFASSQPLHLIGTFVTSIESKYKFTTALFYVVRNATDCLLSGETAIDVGLLTVHFDNIAQTSRTEVHVLKTPPLDNDLPNSKTDKPDFDTTHFESTDQTSALTFPVQRLISKNLKI